MNHIQMSFTQKNLAQSDKKVKHGGNISCIKNYK